uniref:hypothetical protein n=1 Tax=Neisseria zalophi TaxID=640030 RepID=UPI001CD9691F|nr:hypothetical protein [Neisseria zalophi]
MSETTVHNGQTTTVAYAYDPLGNRIQPPCPTAETSITFTTAAATYIKSILTAKPYPKGYFICFE